MNKRREFLKNSSLLTSAFIFSDKFKSIAGISKNHFLFKEGFNSITVFHTNDLHGTVSPFMLGKKSGFGGIENVNKIISSQKFSHILVDAGDFLHNKGSLETHKNFISLMNKAGYAAATIGNRELAKGQDYLASLTAGMNFKLVNCNYEFTNPVLKNKVVPYHIIRHGQFKIGITGVGHDLGSIDKNIKYHHPYKRANEMAAYLKQQMNCDMVICLSHLGMKQKGDMPDNNKFAVASENIDLIISGHNDTILNDPRVALNKEKQQVIVSHAGLQGLMMRKLKFGFDVNRYQNSFESKSYIPGFPVDQSIYGEYKKLTA